MQRLSLLSLFVLGVCGSCAAGELVRERVDPVRIVWTSGHSVSNAEGLLVKKNAQVPDAGWQWERMLEGCCVMTNGGETAGLVLDFGRELHGGLRLAVSARSSRNVRARVRFGESVAEAMSELGERGACNDHAIRDSVIDLPFMGVREIGNNGFRFVRIDLVSPGLLALEAVQAVSLMRAMKPVGAFRSSDERLDRIFDTAVRTAHLCCQDYLWDGIKRDRLVWMGDMHPETMTLLAVFGAVDVVPETLDLMAKITPPDAWMNNFPTYTLCWIRNLAAWYRFTGDSEYLARHADYLVAVFDHLRTVLPKGVWRKEGEYGAFLDWPTHHRSEAELAGAQALAVLAMDDLRFLFEQAQRIPAAEAAGGLLVEMRKVRPDPHGAKSAAALLALSGLREAKEMFATVLGREGAADVSTFYGYYMIAAMGQAGESQHAIDTVRDYWGGMLDMGATSFWEDFNLSWTNNCFRIDELPIPGRRDIHGDFGDFCYKGFRHSFCHGWSSGPAAWCINDVLGIRPLDVGCRTVEVRPALGDLTWAEGALALPTGEAVHVRAERRANGTLDLSVKAPDWVRIVRTGD